jgi:hypothetical protein
MNRWKPPQRIAVTHVAVRLDIGRMPGNSSAPPPAFHGLCAVPSKCRWRTGRTLPDAALAGRTGGIGDDDP